VVHCSTMLLSPLDSYRVDTVLRLTAQQNQQARTRQMQILAGVAIHCMDNYAISSAMAFDTKNGAFHNQLLITRGQRSSSGANFKVPLQIACFRKDDLTQLDVEGKWVSDIFKKDSGCMKCENLPRVRHKGSP
jgi:hypothetical protein